MKTEISRTILWPHSIQAIVAMLGMWCVFLCGIIQATASERIPVIYDTDIGDDIICKSMILPP